MKKYYYHIRLINQHTIEADFKAQDDETAKRLLEVIAKEYSDKIKTVTLFIPIDIISHSHED